MQPARRLRLLLSIAGFLLASIAASASEAYEVRASARARAQFSSFVSDSDESIDTATSASAATGPVMDGAGGVGEASASALLTTGSVSANVRATNGVGDSSAEYVEDLVFTLPPGTLLADVEFRIPVSVSLTGDYLSTVFGVGAAASYRIQLNAPGVASVVATENVFQTSCGSGIACAAPPGELWIQAQVTDQDVVNLTAIAVISEAGSFGDEGGISITLGPARVTTTTSGTTWTSASGVFPDPPSTSVPLLGPVALLMLAGLLSGTAYRLRE